MAIFNESVSLDALATLTASRLFDAKIPAKNPILGEQFYPFGGMLLTIHESLITQIRWRKGISGAWTTIAQGNFTDVLSAARYFARTANEFTPAGGQIWQIEITIVGGDIEVFNVTQTTEIQSGESQGVRQVKPWHKFQPFSSFVIAIDDTYIQSIEYSVEGDYPVAKTAIPRDKILTDRGHFNLFYRHTGANNASILTDSGMNFDDITEILEINVDVIKNLVDGSEGVITAVSGNTVTATLAGGVDNDWDTNDDYEIVDGSPMYIRAQEFQYAAELEGRINVILHVTDTSANEVTKKISVEVGGPMPIIEPGRPLPPQLGVGSFGNGDVAFSRISQGTMHHKNGILEKLGQDQMRRFAYIEDRVGFLIEQETNHQIGYTENFENVAWVKENCTVVSNDAVAPDGTKTADKIVEANDTNQTHVVHQNFNATPGDNAVVCSSFYVKPAGRNWAIIRYQDKSGSISFTYFDLVNKTIGTIGGPATKAAMTWKNVAHGYIRIAVAWNVGTGLSSIRAECGPTTGNDVSQYNGDGSSGIHVWGGQAESAAFATSYREQPGAFGSNRFADIFRFNWGHQARTMTGYMKFTPTAIIELAKIAVFPKLWNISDGTTGMMIQSQLGTVDFVLEYSNGLFSSSGVSYAGVEPYDLVELRYIIAPDQLQIFKSINGAAEVPGTLNTASINPITDKRHLLVVNGGVTGFNTASSYVHALKFAPGKLDLDTVRRL